MKGSISSARAKAQAIAHPELLIQLAHALLEAAGVSPTTSAPPQLIPITQPKELAEAGITHPKTYRAWQWVYWKRHEYGVERGFVKQGSRVLVDVEKYKEALRQQHEAGSVRLQPARRG